MANRQWSPAQIRDMIQDALPNGEIYVNDHLTSAQGTTNNRNAMQAAIDAADALVTTALAGGGDSGFPNVVFGPGDYRIDSAITWKRCNLLGQGSYHGTRILWNGGAAIPIVRPDELRFCRMQGFALNVLGATRPTYWLDLQDTVDFGGKLDDIQFGNSSAGGIKMGGWHNLHWGDLRWDYVGGYAIEATVPSGQYKSSFAIDKITYDHQDAAAGGEGFLQLNIPGDNPDIGRVRIGPGRIETNGAWTGHKAVVDIDHTGGTVYDNSVGLELNDIEFQDSSGMGGDVLIYRSGDTAKFESFILFNVAQSGLSAILGGSWRSTEPVPQLQNLYPIYGYGFPSGLTAHRLVLLASNESWDNFIYARRAGHANDVFRLDRNGTIGLGGGSSDPDTFLWREIAGQLSTAGSFRISNSTAPGTPTDGVVIYAEGGALKVKGSSGTVTVLGPA